MAMMLSLSFLKHAILRCGWRRSATYIIRAFRPMALAMLLLTLSGANATIGEALITATSDEATYQQTKTSSYAPTSITLAQGEFAPRPRSRRGGSRRDPDDIGSGDVVRDVEVPDLHGRNVDWAERELRDLGLIPSPKAEEHWERPGTIFWQSPAPGRRVPPRTHIKFDFAIWPRVPDVVGESTRTARRILDDAGYDFRIETVIDHNRPGIITGQDPERGEKLARGETVIIYERRWSIMPDVVGLDIREAKARLREERLYAVERSRPSNRPVGTVLEQEIKAGEDVRPSLEVTLYVSDWPSVPDLIGKNRDQAGKVLRDLGFKISVEKKVSSKSPDTIIEQSPKPGTELEPKSTVKVVVAERPVVPDIKARHIDQVPRLLADRSFEIGDITYQVSLEPADTVLEQRPRAGVSARFGAAIDVVLVKRLPIPHLLGKSTEDANAILTSMDLRIGNSSERRSDVPPGTVIEQAPEAGVPAMPGTAVDIVVAAPPVVPNVVGMSRDEAEVELRRHFLKLAPVQYRFAESDKVQSQEPAPGSVVSPGSPIKLVLGAPKPSPLKPEAVQVPDVVGLEADDATQQLLDARLKPIPGKSADGEPQNIVRQWPEAAQWVAVGTSVRILSESITEVAVPDLRGLTPEQALALIKESHLTEGLPNEVFGSANIDVVSNQKPLPGLRVPVGYAISLTISTRPSVPDLLGKSMEEAKKILAEQKLVLGEPVKVFALGRPGTISHQQYEPSTRLVPEQVVEVEIITWLSPITIIPACVLVLGVGCTAVLRRSGDASTLVPANMTIVADCQDGTQVVEAESSECCGPRLSFRGRIDPGHQMAIPKECDIDEQADQP